MEESNGQENKAERIKKYCCVMLFSAVEDMHGPDEVSVKNGTFVGENVWYIEVPEKVVGGNNLVSYCPWCGTKLPQIPLR